MPGIIEFFPTPSLTSYLTDLGGETHTFTPAPTMRYGRSKRMWRTPKVHIVAGYSRVAYDDVDERYVVWWCENTAAVLVDKASVHDELPEGFEVCQPCAEQMAFERRRADEQTMPDRAAYNAETQRLLQKATA